MGQRGVRKKAMIPHFVYELILITVLLGFSAFFSSAEIALFSLSKIEKKRLRDRHPIAGLTISNLLNQPRRTLITILIGNMVVNTAVIALVTLSAVKLAGSNGVGWTIAVFTFVLVVIGELVPKIFAVRHDEKVAFLCSIPLDIFARIIYPIRRIVRILTDGILSMLVHERKKDADLISENELKALTRIGEEEGVLKSEEREMIQKLIGLGDRIVREIMTPRTDMVAFDVDEGPEALAQLIRKSHFSYVPVYQESIDNLIGVISTQKFMLDQKRDLKQLSEAPYYIPETKSIDEFLFDLDKTKRRVAICIDEHGGTAGMVTMEDVLEEIFGEFYDEYAKAESLIKEVGNLKYWVHGKIGLHELHEQLGIKLESETSETLNGWLLERFGRIPKPHDSLKESEFEIHVLEVFKQRVVKVELSLKR